MSTMAIDHPTSPPHSSNSRPSSRRSNRSSHSQKSQPSHESEETTPLLSRQGEDDRRNYGHQADGAPSSRATRSLRSIQEGFEGKTNGHYRWASILALSILSSVVVAILCFGFAAPAVVEEYAHEAVVFEPTNLSINSFTASGVRARVQGTFTLDASRVQKKPTADIGRTVAWIAKEIETRESNVKVYLPDYGNVLLGTAIVPSLKVNIRNKFVNNIDFLTDLEPGDVEGLRRIANDWLNGQLPSLLIRGVATVPLRSGLFSLGNQQISESMLFEGRDLPDFPDINVETLSLDDSGPPGQPEGMTAMASVSVMNGYPISFDVAPLHFDVLVPNCLPQQKNLFLGEAKTGAANIRPKQPVSLNVTGLIRDLPKRLTTACPMSNASPLDAILADYLKGNDTTVYVRGAAQQKPETPGWMMSLVKGTTIPLPLPGHPFDNLIRNFSLADVHFSLPDPWAKPGSPQSHPKISATVRAVAALPRDMNFDVNVDRVRADADLVYKGSKLGELDLHKWQTARTSKIVDGDGLGLLIQSRVKEAPLKITDDEAFADLMQSLIFGGKDAALGVKAKVDVNTKTALGELVIRKVPAEGKFYVKPMLNGGLSDLNPEIGSLEILETTESSLTIHAMANITNPTEYSARIPYININILNNNTILGHVIGRDLRIIPGRNTNVLTTATWNPSIASGLQGSEVGRNLISQYISGYNTTLTLKTHRDTIPSQPALGRALSKLEMVINTPKLSLPKLPGDGGKDKDPGQGERGPRFIRDATMHLVSSTASFGLVSPLPRTTFYITSIHANAFYKHTVPVGSIDHEFPFAVPPGESTTPRLPVAWDIAGAGYNAVKDALGGTLKLDAKANASIKVDKWEERIWFVGGGIGAHVQL